MSYKIAYLTSKDPLDKRESSGVYFYQSAALKKHCGEIHYLGPVNSPVIKTIRKALNFLQRFIKKKYNHSHSIIVSKIYGRIFSKKLRQGEYDFVFADKSSSEISFLETSVPLIYSTDATFNLLHGYYPVFSGLMELSIKEGHRIEQNAINRASLVICTSRWAANSVINDYMCPEDKVFIMPRGANIDEPPERERIDARRKNNACRLLFVGQEWHRKGYDIAYQTMRYIRSKGYPVELVVAGCTPPSEFVDEDVTLVNYIDKNTVEGRARFDDIMFNADFLFLPVRAECAAIAFCEAAAYGLPVITRDTGGVSDVVRDGVNGCVLEPEAGYEEYGGLIISTFESDDKYYNLVSSSRDYYEKVLNWDVWGAGMKKILDERVNVNKT